MATSTQTSGDPVRRYEVIEKAYCEGRWATVLEAGSLLLRELPEGEEQPDLAGLRHRMHLLMAHTLLHGYGDRDAAEDLYELVHKSDAESSLRQIAEDGLDQCHKPLSSTFVAEEADEDDEQGRPGLFLPETEAEALEDLALSQKTAKPAPVIAFHALEPPPPEPATEPVSVDGFNLLPRAGRREEAEPADLGLAADPFQPPRGPARPEALNIGVPVMPWVTSTESPPADSDPEEAKPPPLGNETITPPLSIQALVPEVVEEPELMEVHQASASLAEEVELEIAAEKPRLELVSDGFQTFSNEDLDDLKSFLLQVKVG